MLKKIFSIFFILCLAFSFTVHCFAVETDPPDYQVFLSQVYTSAILNASQWVSSYNRDDLQFIVSDISYSGLQFRSTSRFVVGHTYLISYYGSASLNRRITWNFYNSSSGQYFKQFTQILTTEPTFYTHVYTLTDTCNFFWLFKGYDMPSGTQVNIQHLNILDITGIDDPSLYYDPTTYIDTGYYQIPNFFQPFLDFHSHLFETFSFFPELGSTYSALFTFVIIITSLLLVIFVVVFLIKRFTGGKT